MLIAEHWNWLNWRSLLKKASTERVWRGLVRGKEALPRLRNTFLLFYHFIIIIGLQNIRLTMTHILPKGLLLTVLAGRSSLSLYKRRIARNWILGPNTNPDSTLFHFPQQFQNGKRGAQRSKYNWWCPAYHSDRIKTCESSMSIFMSKA